MNTSATSLVEALSDRTPRPRRTAATMRCWRDGCAAGRVMARWGTATSPGDHGAGATMSARAPKRAVAPAVPVPRFRLPRSSSSCCTSCRTSSRQMTSMPSLGASSAGSCTACSSASNTTASGSGWHDLSHLCQVFGRNWAIAGTGGVKLARLSGFDKTHRRSSRSGLNR